MCDMLACAKMQVFTFLVYLTIVSSFAASVVTSQVLPTDDACQMVIMSGGIEPCHLDPDFSRYQVTSGGGDSGCNGDARPQCTSTVTVRSSVLGCKVKPLTYIIIR